MKTEHACAYLPYGLKWSDNEELIYSTFGLTDNGYATLHLKGYAPQSKWIEDWIRIGIKPVLRKLSDLTKEITNDGEAFVPIEQLVKPEINVSVSDIKIVGHFVDFRGRALMRLDYYWMYHRHVQTLLSWRFDVFNLIESGEAIDVNTLEKNPYE